MVSDACREDAGGRQWLRISTLAYASHCLDPASTDQVASGLIPSVTNPPTMSLWHQPHRWGGGVYIIFGVDCAQYPVEARRVGR